MKILVIGAGNIGTAMARGLVQGGDVTVFNRSVRRLAQFSANPAIATTTDLDAALSGKPDIIMVCTEGDAVEPLLGRMAPALTPGTIVCSCAAAVSIARMEAVLPPECPVVRVLPNIAATVGQSVNLVAANAWAAPFEERLLSLLAATGESFAVPESQFAAAMAISSCGIAYAAKYIRATAGAGVAAGLSEPLATRLCAATVAGTVALLEKTGEHPEQLIDRVTTPGGLTARGLLAMEQGGFTHATQAAILAAAKYKL